MRRILTLVLTLLVNACTTVEIKDILDENKITTLSFFPWEIKHVSSKGSSSKCLGDLTDPICATETGIACIASINLPACKAYSLIDSSGKEDHWAQYVIYRSAITNNDKLYEDISEPDSNCDEDCEEFTGETIDPRHFQSFFLFKYCDNNDLDCSNSNWVNRGFIFTETLNHPEYGYYWYLGVLQYNPGEKYWHGED